MLPIGFALVAAVALHGHPRLSTHLTHSRVRPVVLSAKKRTFEFCAVDESGEIESCELVAEDDLPMLLGLEQTARVLSDPMASELFFGKRVDPGQANAANADEGTRAKLEQVFARHA